MTANGHTTPTLTTPETTAATLAAVAAAANTMAALASSTAVYPKTEDPSRPFACGVCPKRFRMKHHLKVSKPKITRITKSIKATLIKGRTIDHQNL